MLVVLTEMLLAVSKGNLHFSSSEIINSRMSQDNSTIRYILRPSFAILQEGSWAEC